MTPQHDPATVSVSVSGLPPWSQIASVKSGTPCLLSAHPRIAMTRGVLISGQVGYAMGQIAFQMIAGCRIQSHQRWSGLLHSSKPSQDCQSSPPCETGLLDRSGLFLLRRRSVIIPKGRGRGNRVDVASAGTERPTVDEFPAEGKSVRLHASSTRRDLGDRKIDQSAEHMYLNDQGIDL